MADNESCVIKEGETSGRTARVLLIGNTSWYLWSFRRRLAEHLHSRGYDVVFAAPRDGYSARLAAIGRYMPFEMDRKGRNPLAEVGTLVRLGKLLWQVRADAVLTWTPKPNIYGALCGWILRVPVIANVAGLGFAFIGDRGLAHVAGLLYRLSLRHCEVVFFQNGYDRDQFVDAGWVGSHAARLVPGSGVDLERFRPRPRMARGGILFLFVGRLLVDKGLRELIEATRRLRSEGARLRVAGFIDPGNPATIDEEEIRSWQLEGVVEYIGRTDAAEQLYVEADCVVLPSYREGMPRTLLEAAASARPVIATDVPGCRDAVLDGRTGYLCRAKDVGSLVEAMRRMMTLSSCEREEMGRAGRAWMEREFSEEVVFRSYSTALWRLMRTGSSGDAVRTE